MNPFASDNKKALQRLMKNERVRCLLYIHKNFLKLSFQHNENSGTVRSILQRTSKKGFRFQNILDTKIIHCMVTKYKTVTKLIFSETKKLRLLSRKMLTEEPRISNFNTFQESGLNLKLLCKFTHLMNYHE